jgi:nucleoside-diphosphate-sugar epimerase
MTVVMTGGAGFLGLHLLRELVQAGRHVTVLAHGDAPATRQRIRRALPDLPTAGFTTVAADVTHHRLDLSDHLYRRLAAEAEEVWHVAGLITLSGDDERVRRTNRTGTTNVLRFTDTTSARVPLRHISTAFVAGTAQGRVREDDSLDVDSFENTYERSKHAAERLVRAWATARDRSALTLRPSVLVPPAPTNIRHTIGTVEYVLRGLTNQSGRLVLRLAADPRAHLNLVPVDWAAHAMLRAAADGHQGSLHVVHPEDIPVRGIAAALEDRCAVRLRMMPAFPANPTQPERVFYRRAAGFLPYLYHRRQFDDTELRAALPDLPAPPTIDRAYLRRVLATGHSGQAAA